MASCEEGIVSGTDFSWGPGIRLGYQRSFRNPEILPTLRLFPPVGSGVYTRRSRPSTQKLGRALFEDARPGASFWWRLPDHNVSNPSCPLLSAIFLRLDYDSRMSKTESSMVELGTVAPPFELSDVVTGRAVGRDDVADGARGLLVMFICVHCPFVKHVEQELARIGAEYEGKIGMVAISSNDVAAYPEDSPAEMKEQAQRLGFRFPYLYDETQEVAREYNAACTPDFFLFDGEMKLVYRGQLDDSRPQRPSGRRQRYSGDGQRPARGDGRGARRQAAGHQPAEQPRVQHQMAGVEQEYTNWHRGHRFSVGSIGARRCQSALSSFVE